MKQIKNEKLSLSQLTAEQKNELKKELEAEQKLESKRVNEERKNYKTLVNDEVKRLFPALQDASKALSMVKEYVFDSLKTLIVMKSELYDREEDQTSHSFSTAEGEITIIIGYNMNDGWDDTVNTGVAKVTDYMQTLVHDKDSKDLVDTIMKLLSKDSKGNLKASRVLQLKQLADMRGDKTFIDAIQIIQDAYRPVRSKEFIRCDFKDNKGGKVNLPLSITDAPFPATETAENNSTGS